MNYRIISRKEETGSIILKRTRTMETVLSVICFLIGIVFLPVGLILFLSPGYDPHYPFFWTGFGLLFTMGGVMVSTQIKIPEFLMFDNNNGELIINGKKNDEADQAVIPYNEIEGFHVRSHVSNRSTSHAVEMEKKDGAFWTLFSVSSKEKADSFRDDLAKRVNLGVSARGTGEAPKPDHMDVAATGETTAFTWANRSSFKGYILLVTSLAAMGMIIYGSKPYATGPVQYYIAVGFICLITALAVLSIINNIGRKHRIEVTKESLTYRKTGGIIKTGEFSIPTGEIDTILFNFALSTTDTALYVLKKDEKDFFQKIRRGTFDKSDIFSAIAMIKSLRKIEVGDLSIAGKVALESLLQKTVYELSGRKGL